MIIACPLLSKYRLVIDLQRNTLAEYNLIYGNNKKKTLSLNNKLNCQYIFLRFLLKLITSHIKKVMVINFSKQ